MTLAQFRNLTLQARQMERPAVDRQMEICDLVAMGYDLLTAEHILNLLSQETQLERYLEQGAMRDCYPITRVSDRYPQALRQRLGANAPGCLWAKGDIALLETPALSLVGSRELQPVNRDFAVEIGRQAALQGITLVSGNARGADQVAQESCLANGGKVISVVADRLDKCPLQRNVLYLSEDGFDLPFSSQRALSRNRIIHALGHCVFVAQVRAHKGGTWSGSTRNLKEGWSPVLCLADGTDGYRALIQEGARAVTLSELPDLFRGFQGNLNYK